MTVGKNRFRLAVEQVEDRCTPSALGGGLAALIPAPHGGLHAAAAERVEAPKGPAIPFQVAFQCIANLSTLTASATGSATPWGSFTGEGLIDSASIHIDEVAYRGVYSGTYTVVTASGDELFCEFTTWWRLSTGEGRHWITVTGGTGELAGATGHASLRTTITADPTSPSTLTCDSSGPGVLILTRR